MAAAGSSIVRTGVDGYHEGGTTSGTAVPTRETPGRGRNTTPAAGELRCTDRCHGVEKVPRDSSAAEARPRDAPAYALLRYRPMTALLKTLILDDDAQGMTEYAILVGTLALGAIATLLLIGNRVKNVFGGVNTALNNVPTS